VVVRFIGTRQGVAWGKPVLMLLVAPRQGGLVFDLVVPNRDLSASKLDPDPSMAGLARSLKRGDLIQVATFRHQGRDLISSFDVYVPQPGEDEPNVYRLVKTVPEPTRLGVVLQKDERTLTVYVPSRRLDEGKWVQDEKIAAAVKGLKQGDLVEVHLEGSVITRIGRYQPPEKAEFVRTFTEEVNEVTYQAVELRRGQESVTLLIPAGRNEGGGVVSDGQQVAKVRALKPGEVVQFTSRQQDGRSYLVDIKATSQRAVSRPTSETAQPALRPGG
jgi:hypothetical protein